MTADGLWSAPETLAGEPHTPAADMYAMGLLLCYMFSAKEPFAEEAARLSLRQLPQLLRLSQLNDLRPRLPPSMPTALRGLIPEFWHASADRRPGWADAADRLYKALAADRPPPPAVEDRSLVEELLPPHVVKVLRRGGTFTQEYYDCVSVMFVDVVGFTTLSSDLPASKVTSMLSRFFAKVDAAVARLDLFKVEARAPPPRTGPAPASAVRSSLHRRSLTRRVCVLDNRGRFHRGWRHPVGSAGPHAAHRAAGAAGERPPPPPKREMCCEQRAPCEHFPAGISPRLSTPTRRRRCRRRCAPQTRLWWTRMICPRRALLGQPAQQKTLPNARPRSRSAAASLPAPLPLQGVVHVRVGVHTGPVTGALVGTTRRKYTLLGGERKP